MLRRTLASTPVPAGPGAPDMTQPNVMEPASAFTNGPTQATAPPVEARNGPFVTLPNERRFGS